MVLIQNLLRAVGEKFFTCLILLLDIGERLIALALLFELHHALFACPGRCTLLFALFLENFLLGESLLLALEYGGCFHSLNVRQGDHHCVFWNGA